MKETQKKLLIPLAILAIVAIGGSVYTLSHSGPITAHAQTPTTQVKQQNNAASGGDTEVKDTASNEIPHTATQGAEKETKDGPGGHQDPSGTQVDHQFNGTE